jgi:hypothetical protein
MAAGKTVDSLLAGARLAPRPYTAEHLRAAGERLAAKLADRMLHGALTFDDATRVVRDHAAFRTAHRPSPPCAGTRAPEADLRLLCRLVIGQPDALHAMSTFVAGRILEPDGARVLACVLHLAGRSDSARFWWQYAAGAGDVCACYCLFLHHTAHGETVEANWWHDQADPRRERDLWIRADRYAMTLGWSTVLVLAADRRPAAQAMADEVFGYVPDAVRWVDEDVELPLPDDGFAERIEEITSH